MGFRVICVSLLPIDSSTLIYGSSDGGHVVHNDNETMFEIMQKIGAELHLKEHLVKEKRIIGAVDCEGHTGYDGRFYLVDASRLFPPVYIPNRIQKIHGSIWFRLFREEFLRRYSKSLSSDAFSVMGIHDREEHNNEIVEASTYLETKIIPNFACQFEQSFFKALEINLQSHSKGNTHIDTLKNDSFGGLPSPSILLSGKWNL